tara:strand:+ start:93 stop:320 length:228 start_codon:yes stop_codon:yes gene_type:complete
MMMFAKNNYIDDKSNVAAARQHDASKKSRNSDYFLQYSNKSADSNTQPRSCPGHRKQTIISVTAMVEQRQDDIDN